MVNSDPVARHVPPAARQAEGRAGVQCVARRAGRYFDGQALRRQHPKHRLVLAASSRQAAAGVAASARPDHRKATRPCGWTAPATARRARASTPPRQGEHDGLRPGHQLEADVRQKLGAMEAAHGDTHEIRNMSACRRPGHWRRGLQRADGWRVFYRSVSRSAPRRGPERRRPSSRRRSGSAAATTRAEILPGTAAGGAEPPAHVTDRCTASRRSRRWPRRSPEATISQVGLPWADSPTSASTGNEWSATSIDDAMLATQPQRDERTGRSCRREPL